MTLSLEEAARLRAILDAARVDISNLSGWQRGFIKDQITRWDAEGAQMHVTPGQWKHILAIGEKLGA